MFDGFREERIRAKGADIHMVIGGSGRPLLLLHGYPQTHVMWHKVAPSLAADFTVVVPDLRGYGDSSKPESDEDHLAYSKRVTARDMVDVMKQLGFETFRVAGHDRGGRVTHRMALDYPDSIERCAVLDIVPTHKIFSDMNQKIATGYYHWLFLIQPGGLPEKMIGEDPEYYLRDKLARWSAGGATGETTLAERGFTDEAVAEYVRCFSKPETIHASCEDYRAAATIDLEHDEEDMDRKVETPLLVLWGGHGLMEENYDVPETWRERASDVRGRALDCGHFLPEEAPDDTWAELRKFFR